METHAEIKARARAEMLEAGGLTDFGDHEAQVGAFLDWFPLTEEESEAGPAGDQK